MPRAKNGSLTKIGVVWQKSDFWTKNRDFGPKKKRSLLGISHVLATTGKSCPKKKSAFAQIIKGGNVILGDFLGSDPFLGQKGVTNEPPWSSTLKNWNTLISWYSAPTVVSRMSPLGVAQWEIEIPLFRGPVPQRWCHEWALLQGSLKCRISVETYL